MEAVKRARSDSHHSSAEKHGKTSIKSSTKKNKKSKKKDRKRKHSSCRYDSDDEPPRKKSKSKHKKKCKKGHKHGKEKKHKLDKEKHMKKHKSHRSHKEEEEPDIGPEVPANTSDKAHSMAPMSKEEWSKQQKNIRRVYDEETGRTRLVRGEGEIIEEIVSRDRHREINRQATRADGHSFQSKITKRIS